MIKLVDLSYKIKEKNIFSDINFSINKGDYVSIIGKNGTGKSILAKIIVGLDKDYLGEYYFDEIEQKTVKDINPKIAILFQNPSNQIITSMVENDIAFGLENNRIPQSEMHPKIDAVLEKLNITHLKKRTTDSLSGGEKQKVALASLLILDFDTYIFDEVSSLLDPQSTLDILSIIEDLHKEGKTIVTITHKKYESRKADRILSLDEFSG